MDNYKIRNPKRGYSTGKVLPLFENSENSNKIVGRVYVEVLQKTERKKSQILINNQLNERMQLK